MLRRRLVLLVTCLSLLVFVTACGDDDDDNDDDNNDNDNDDAADDDAADDDAADDDTTVDATSSATPGRDDTQLSDAHSGWKNADCFACHDDQHRGGFSAGECATCHGNNGATQRPANHAINGCADCHADSHAGANFVSPANCVACHKYEDGGLCPATADFDVVVIGSGGGGVTAAAALARGGLNVALVEQHYKVGGYMNTFRRGDYNFDASLHAIGGLEGDGGAAESLRSVGVLDNIKPIKCDPIYRSIFPGLDVEIPADIDDYRAKLKELYPDQAAGIDGLFDEMTSVYAALGLVMELSEDFSIETLQELLGDLPSALRLIEYMFVTLEDVIDRYITDPELAGLWAQLVTYIGDGPANLQALYFLNMWNSYHREGFYYLEGGSGAITQALADEFVANGGTLLLNTRATRIVIQDGNAVQVQTEGDACLNTRYVVSNANARYTLLTMVGAENLPADYVADVEGMEVGVATIQVFLGLDHDYTAQFPGSHELMINDSYDMDEGFDWMRDGDAEHAPFIIANYTEVDPTTAPAGKNAIALTTYLPYDLEGTWKWNLGYDDYVDFKEEVAWILINRAMEHLPELDQHIEVLAVGTPMTNVGYSSNTEGSILGWANTPEQGTLRRLPQQTPIDNLILAGAWTFPGGGQSAVISSGIGAAKMILAREEARKK